MIINKYGQQIYTEQDLIDIYMVNPEKIIAGSVTVSENIIFDDNLELDSIPNLFTYTVNDNTIEQFDAACQNKWFMPKE